MWVVLVKIHDILTATILPPCHKMIYDVKVNAGETNSVRGIGYKLVNRRGFAT